MHPRFLTPHISTIAIGVIASVWFAVLFPLSENFVYDSLTSLALMISFYYALTRAWPARSTTGASWPSRSRT